MGEENPQKPETRTVHLGRIGSVLILGLGLLLAACRATGGEATLAKMAIPEGVPGKNIALIDHETVCGVFVEEYEEVPGSGTVPDKVYAKVTLFSEFDSATNSAPLHVLEPGDQVEGDNGCVVEFEGLGTKSIDGYQKRAAAFTVYGLP